MDSDPANPHRRLAALARRESFFLPGGAGDRLGVVCVFQRSLESRVVEAISQLLLRDAHRCDRFGSDLFENRAGSPAEDAAQSVGRRVGAQGRDQNPYVVSVAGKMTNEDTSFRLARLQNSSRGKLSR
jgi:hypothetical protein